MSTLKTEAGTIVVPRRPLAKALALVCKAVPRRNAIPIYGNVVLLARDGILTVQSADPDREISVAVPCGDGSLCTTVEARPLARLLRVIWSDPVTLEATRTAEMQPRSYRGGPPHAPAEMVEVIVTTLRVSGGLVSADLPGELAEGAPANFTEDAMAPPAWRATLGREAMDAIQRCRGSASHEETRYYLNGVYFHGGPEGFQFAATDGHRLTACRVPLPDASGAEPPGIILPHEGIRLAMSIWRGKAVEMEINPRRTKVRLRGAGDGVTLSFKVIDGTFPAYEKVVPTKIDRHLKVRRADLIGAIDVATSMYFGASRDKSLALKIEVSGDALAVSTAHGDVAGKASAAVVCESDIPSWVFGINGRYLRGLLSNLQGAEFVILQCGADTVIERDGKTKIEQPGPIVIVSPEVPGVRNLLMTMRL